MSGPVTVEDAGLQASGAQAEPITDALEVTESHEATVGALPVRRALPRRARRTVGAWCFVDHMGPAAVTEEHGVDIGPHPHIGLQTVTWLVTGEVLHRDSLGSEQIIRPGQLNLMTAGHGVSHSEEATGRYRGDLHGVQLWVAQPERTRHAAPQFEHHHQLPRVDLEHGAATVLVGSLKGALSPARRDTDHTGADLALGPGDSSLPLLKEFEYALVVLEGAVSIRGQAVVPGHLAYLGLGRDEIVLSATQPTRVLMIGGKPFEEPLLMWWNFVARSRQEIGLADEQWRAGDNRFGRVASSLPPMTTDPSPWTVGTP